MTDSTGLRPDVPDELLSRFDEEIGEAIADALGEELGNSPRIVELTTAVMADVSPNLAEFQRQVRERVAAESAVLDPKDLAELLNYITGREGIRVVQEETLDRAFAALKATQRGES